MDARAHTPSSRGGHDPWAGAAIAAMIVVVGAAVTLLAT